MVAEKKSPPLPPLTVPLLYLAFGALCFAVALAGMIRFAQDFTGFYYHPRILALTHLVTLGWISANILGSFYWVAGITLQMPLRYGWRDHLIFWLFALGVSGMASHFWIAHYSGMVWSAGCAYSALVAIAWKVFRALPKTKTPRFVKLHISLAFSNIIVAGLWGILIGLNKIHGFLPASSSSSVIAHAHLAAAGWAMMIVFGISYRLLPMFLPAAPAEGVLPWFSAILLEVGIIGLFVSLLTASAFTIAFAILLTAGITIFLYNAIRTLLRRKPAPPPAPRRPDFSMLQVLFSFLCLMAAIIAGLTLLRLPATEATLQLALAYGFTAIVGFLGQMIIGMKPKIISIIVWYYAFQKTGNTEKIPRPVDMPVRPFQAFIFFLWLAGLPMIVAGILNTARLMILAGALSLMCGLIISVIHEIAILRLLLQKRSDEA